MVGRARAVKRVGGRGNLPGQVASSANDGPTLSSGNVGAALNTTLATSATADGLCGICNLTVGNDSIGCDQCTHWYHPTPQCTGLKTNAIACIQEEGGDVIRFVCSECRCNTRSEPRAGTRRNVASSDSNVSAIGQLFEMVKSIAQSVAGLTTKLESIVSSRSSDTQHVSGTIVTGVTSRDSLFSEFREYEERKKRRESLIVRGIVAANDSEFSRKFGGVSSAIVGNNVVPESIVCINRQNHLYRIKIADDEVRRNILINSKKLKDDNTYKNVYLSKDLTYLQRQEQRARRASDLSRRGNGSRSVGFHNLS